MDESQTPDSVPEKTAAAIGSAARNEEKQPASGMEINLGDFTRTQVLMRSLRLTLKHQIVVQVEEIASAVSDAGRRFKMGDIEQANQDVGRLY